MAAVKICRICGNTESNRDWRLPEVLLRKGEVFDYFECGSCGCLQIAEVPAELGKYYPDDYYSFKRHDRLARARVRGFFDRYRVRHQLGEPNLIGWLGSLFAKPLGYLEWVQGTGVRQDARILDVGCGSGKYLVQMALGGFTSCQGVDPFVPETLRYDNGVVVHKMSLDALAEAEAPFDFIMMHHSLEHMPEQQAALKAVRALLAPGGTLMIRIPVASSYGWRHYREHWVALEPPLHLYLHTHQSLRVLAAQAGLNVTHQYCDAPPNILMWSEIYQRTGDARMGGNETCREKLSRDEFRAFTALSARANHNDEGDLAVYFLKALDHDGAMP